MATHGKGPAVPNDPESLVFKKPPQHYFMWQKDEGISIHETLYVENLAAAELARKGVEIKQEMPWPARSW
jgi:hypothetical protein